MICPHCHKEIETREVLQDKLEATLLAMQKLDWGKPDAWDEALRLATQLHEIKQRLKNRDYYV